METRKKVPLILGNPHFYGQQLSFFSAVAGICVEADGRLQHTESGLGRVGSFADSDPLVGAVGLDRNCMGIRYGF